MEYVRALHTIIILGLADLAFINVLAVITAGTWLYRKVSADWEIRPDYL